MTTKPAFAGTPVTIAELGQDPDAIIEAANAAPVTIVINNRAAAYVVAAHVFEAMENALEDAELAEIAISRRDGPTWKVSLDDL